MKSQSSENDRRRTKGSNGTSEVDRQRAMVLAIKGRRTRTHVGLLNELVRIRSILFWCSISQIRLAANEENGDVGTADRTDFLDPLTNQDPSVEGRERSALLVRETELVDASKETDQTHLD